MCLESFHFASAMLLDKSSNHSAEFRRSHRIEMLEKRYRRRRKSSGGNHNGLGTIFSSSTQHHAIPVGPILLGGISAVAVCLLWIIGVIVYASIMWHNEKHQGVGLALSRGQLGDLFPVARDVAVNLRQPKSPSSFSSASSSTSLQSWHMQLWPKAEQYADLSSDEISSLTSSGSTEEAFSSLAVQLAARLEHIMMKRCLPELQELCRDRSTNVNMPDEADDQPQLQQQRVGILRVPGVLGTLMQDFVTNEAFYKSAPDSIRHNTALIPVVNIQDPLLTKFVRLTTLPILLQALDLALETVDTSDVRGTKVMTTDDILTIVRLLIRWHCHISATLVDQEHTSIQSVSLQMIMMHPELVKEDTADFLGYLHIAADGGVTEGEPDRKFTRVNEHALDVLAKQVLQRIDACVSLASQLSQTSSTIDKLNPLSQAAVDAAIQTEIDKAHLSSSSSSSCGSLDLERDDSIPVTNKVAQIVSRLLQSNNGLTSVCQEYPSIALCINYAKRRAEGLS